MGELSLSSNEEIAHGMKSAFMDVAIANEYTNIDCNSSDDFHVGNSTRC